LSDAFELRFRVLENENDTGWVEKLSNVGSEGTDILVKAMINIMLLNVFKESASRKFKDFKLHCMMDEIGRLHPGNVQGILKFANDRNILLINGSPVVQDAMAYRHIYELRKDQDSQTRIKRLVSIKEQTDSVDNA
ncbi:MAG: ATP-binding protein, partial [Bacteroidetes bacterium SW_10_40_5]